MQNDLSIAVLTPDRIGHWLEQSIAQRGDRHLRRLIGFGQDVERGIRVIWAAWEGERLLGQVTVQHESEYPPFRRNGIFEIVDVWVVDRARRQGIAQAMLSQAIDYAAEKKAPAIGLGVGVTANFGAAHRVYARLGFMPDGTGLWVQGQQAAVGETVTLEDGVLMMWKRNL